MKRAAGLFGAIPVAIVAVAATGLAVSRVSAAPAPETVFIVDAEPGVGILENDVAVLGGAGTTVEAGVIYGESLTIQAHDLATDVRWFVDVRNVPAGPPGVGSWVGSWQSGTFGETTSLTLSGGPSSQACQRSASLFHIDELQAAPDGHVTALALGYTWFCEGGVPAVYGEVRINSTVPVAALRADRTTVAFDPVAVGTPAAVETVSLDNPGDTDERLSLRLTGLDRGAFEIVDDGCSGATLQVGSACQLGVRFTPQRTGPAHAIVEVTDNTVRGVRTIDLEGTTVP